MKTFLKPDKRNEALELDTQTLCCTLSSAEVGEKLLTALTACLSAACSPDAVELWEILRPAFRSCFYNKNTAEMHAC